MDHQTLFRYSGIAAVLSVLLYIASMIAWMGADPQGVPPALASLLYQVSSVLFLVPLYALYIVLRRNATALVVSALVILVVATIASLFIDATDMTNPLVIALTVAWGAGALLLGLAGLRNAWVPRASNYLLFVMAALAVFAAPFMAMGATNLAGIANLVLGLVYVVWLLWMAFRFFSVQSTGRITA